MRRDTLGGLFFFFSLPLLFIIIISKEIRRSDYTCFRVRLYVYILHVILYVVYVCVCVSRECECECVCRAKGEPDARGGYWARVDGVRG